MGFGNVETRVKCVMKIELSLIFNDDDGFGR